MEVIIRGEPKEIAALARELQGRRISEQLVGGERLASCVDGKFERSGYPSHELTSSDRL